MAHYSIPQHFNKVTIDLKALGHNFKLLQDHFPQRPLMGVVKGDAYGHGLVECAKTLVNFGCKHFGVLDVFEGVKLREAGIKHEDIYILGGVDSYSHIPAIVSNKLNLFVYDFELLEALTAQSRGHWSRVKVFLKVDTGMGRLGLNLWEAEAFFKEAKNRPFLEVMGLATHLPTVGDLLALKQLDFFERFCLLAEKIFEKKLVNTALSGGGLLAHPDYLDGLSRPGLVLYGVPPQLSNPQEDLEFSRLSLRRENVKQTISEISEKLKKVMTFSSQLLQVKYLRSGQTVSYDRTFVAPERMRVGIVPVGYVHGLHVNRSDKVEVLIRGNRVRQIGRICMNLSVYDLSSVSDVRPGEEVVFLGDQLNDSLDAFQDFKGERQSPYEVLCLYGKLNNRVYV
ncbi:MAG: alanine racemase [Deltaproteobacteria bacterium]|jgi:alanine racemase|nr:alanine racemase [Deltaproteobacteria bacterium]